MKRFLTTVLAIGSVLLLRAAEDKKPLDCSVFDIWETAEVTRLTPDGKYLIYQINRQDADGELHIRKMASGEEVTIPRGGSFQTSEDAVTGIFWYKAPKAEVRQAKIDKKKKEETPRDTLAYIDLETFRITKVKEATGAKIAAATSPKIVADIEVKDRKGIKNLLIIDPASGNADTLKNTASYELSRDGRKLALTTRKDKKDSLSFSSVILYDLTSGKADTLSRDRSEYTGISFNHDSNAMVFLSTDQEEENVGTRSWGISLVEEKVIKKASRKQPAGTVLEIRELIPQEYPLHEDWLVSDKAGVRFSNASRRLILQLNRHVPAKDTTIVSFETAALDIWRWDAETTPPEDKKGGRPETLTAVINLDRAPDRLLVLSKNHHDMISFANGADGDIALSRDRSRYFRQSFWDYNDYCDAEIVNLNDGSRTLVGEKLPDPSISTFGKYVAWFGDDGQWYCYNVATGATVNLTSQTGESFVNDEIDTPSGISPWTGRTWLGNDEYLLLGGKYDLWKFSPDGKLSQNLTKGEGTRTRVRYRYTNFEQNDNSHLFQNIKKLPIKGKAYLTAFDDIDKKNGFATMDISAPSVPDTRLNECSYSYWTKVKGGGLIIYRKGDFNNPMNLYASTDDCSTETRITSINPQMKDYLWGRSQLVSWKAYDGTPLKGILYTPENLDPTKKYPMIIYFYEKNTQNLFAHYSPVPSRSIINFPFYTSNGYVVFVPDIVYTTGHPGESAYNCICSGAEDMCRQFPFINKDKMAIQGQSWGGYQTTYLVTRTDMFAAAEAGAPVSNMTSAYGGIRWGSGNSRIGQYEHGQSRIGKTLWEEGGLELYLENSPVFKADKVKTPLMIMHNDNDGAVPWYQGIEMFMALRRLGKPCWLVEYNNEEHNLSERRNSKDLTIRIFQFFNHFLKDEPEPMWMKKGIPHSRKGYYFGYELSE